MPNFSFVPIIGSNFDAVAAQQANWANFNRAVEESNLQRAAAAEINRNNYLAQVAAMQNAAQERNIANQLAQESIGRQLGWTLGQEATRRRERQEDIAAANKQFEAGLQLDREKINAAAQNVRDRLTLQQEEQKQKIDLTGQALAGSYLQAQALADATDKAYTATLDKIASLEKQKSEAMGAEEPNVLKLADLNAQIKTLTSELRTRETAKNRAENAFQAFQATIRNRGFDFDDDAGKIIHPSTGKTWDFRMTKPDNTPIFAAPDGGAGFSFAPVPGRSWQMPTPFIPFRAPTSGSTKGPVATGNERVTRVFVIGRDGRLVEQ